jgi:FMN phosphatase YigB (HAD superfamily)
LDYYLRPLIEKLKDIKLLSLDIFDTLLFRTVGHPTDVFIQAAEAALESGFLRSGVTPQDYRLLRIQAEASAREQQIRLTGHDEITLEMIYEEMPDHVGDRGRLLEQELEEERKVCFLNPNITSLMESCKEHGIQVVLLSDMYLSCGQVRALLQSSGLKDDHVDLLLMSCEQFCSKVNGGLFDCLLAKYPDVPLNTILHIGDSRRADVDGAALRGIPSIHYAVIPDTFERSYHWDQVRHGSVLPQLRAISKLTEHTLGEAISKDEHELFFYGIGVRTLGPFLSSFCEWVVDVCVAEGRTELHPLMREAVLIAPLLDQIIAQRGLAIAVRPIYISRQATYLAALEKFGERELDGLLNTDCKVMELFQTLDMVQESGAFAGFLDRTISQAAELLDASGELISDKLRRFLLDEPIIDKINSSIARHRFLLRDYLQQTCTDAARMVTVDVGYHGTMQKNIELMLQGDGSEAQSIHLLAIGGDGLARLQLKGMDIRTHLGGVGRNEDLARAIVRSPSFLEELLMSDFGTTLGYKREDLGKVNPVLAPLQQELSELRYKQASQAGVMAFQRSYYELRQLKSTSLNDRAAPREWYKPLHRIITMPTPEEAEVLGNLKHQDHYLREPSAICPPMSDHWFANGEEAFLRACNFGPSTLNAYWPQGDLTRRSPYYLYKQYLKTADSFGIESMLFELIITIAEEGIREINVLGSGGLAARVMERAELHQITVKHFVQSRERLSELLVENVSQLAPSCYVIASLVEEDIAVWRECVEAACRGSLVYAFDVGV